MHLARCYSYLFCDFSPCTSFCFHLQYCFFILLEFCILSWHKNSPLDMVYLFYHIKGAFVYCPFLTDLCTTTRCFILQRINKLKPRNETLASVAYCDKWNRLVREDNHKLAKTYTWSYDIGGNILEKSLLQLRLSDIVTGLAATLTKLSKSHRSG